MAQQDEQEMTCLSRWKESQDVLRAIDLRFHFHEHEELKVRREVERLTKEIQRATTVIIDLSKQVVRKEKDIAVLATHHDFCEQHHWPGMTREQREAHPSPPVSQGIFDRLANPPLVVEQAFRTAQSAERRRNERSFELHTEATSKFPSIPQNQSTSNIQSRSPSTQSSYGSKERRGNFQDSSYCSRMQGISHSGSNSAYPASHQYPIFSNAHGTPGYTDSPRSDTNTFSTLTSSMDAVLGSSVEDSPDVAYNARFPHQQGCLFGGRVITDELEKKLSNEKARDEAIASGKWTKPIVENEELNEDDRKPKYEVVGEKYSGQVSQKAGPGLHSDTDTLRPLQLNANAQAKRDTAMYEHTTALQSDHRPMGHQRVQDHDLNRTFPEPFRSNSTQEPHDGSLMARRSQASLESLRISRRVSDSETAARIRPAHFQASAQGNDHRRWNSMNQELLHGRAAAREPGKLRKMEKVWNFFQKNGDRL